MPKHTLRPPSSLHRLGSDYSDPYVAGYNQLLMLIKGKSYPEAIQLFQELVAEGYNRAELYNLVSEAYLKTDQLQQAYDVLRTATKPGASSRRQLRRSGFSLPGVRRLSPGKGNPGCRYSLHPKFLSSLYTAGRHLCDARIAG